MQRIAILGVGLIGGSLGLVWKQRLQDVHVVGFDNAPILEKAVDRGAIDEGVATLPEAVESADVVVLAAPLTAIVATLETIAPYLRAGSIVTDVGSVKRPVLDRAAAVLPSDVPFVGGHPMAGSERRGIEHADPFIFENATYAVCPATTSFDFPSDFPALYRLIRATGGRILVLDADRHDQIAATVSHLPQLLAVCLMNYAAERNREDDAFLRLAAGGFRDMTRIASSPYTMWRDVLVANEGPILDVLAGFASSFQRLRGRIGAEALDEVEQAFTSARSARESIPRDTKGFIHPLSDVYVYAEDRPGELLGIVRTLHDAGLNIKDIELLKIREGTGGAFRFGFNESQSADHAVSALTLANYTAYRL